MKKKRTRDPHDRSTTRQSTCIIRTHLNLFTLRHFKCGAGRTVLVGSDEGKLHAGAGIAAGGNVGGADDDFICMHGEMRRRACALFTQRVTACVF